MNPSLPGSDMIATMSGKVSIFAFSMRMTLGARPHHDVRTARKPSSAKSKKSLILLSALQ